MNNKLDQIQPTFHPLAQGCFSFGEYRRKSVEFFQRKNNLKKYLKEFLKQF